MRGQVQAIVLHRVKNLYNIFGEAGDQGFAQDGSEMQDFPWNLNDEGDSGKARSLPARLANQIINRAKQLDLSAGSHLTEQSLADLFRVSRTPVRLALQFLVELDVVENRPRQGFFLKRRGGQLESSKLNTEDSEQDFLYFRIAEERLTGAIAQSFTEQELMRRYGASRARITRLLAKMVQEGWLARLPGHGWEFQPVLSSAAAYAQSYSFRMVIEPAAVLEPGFRVDITSFNKARYLQEAMLNGGILSFSNAETFQIGSQFHETLMAACGNPFYLEGVKRVNRLRRLLEYRIQSDRTRLTEICKQHIKILDLLELGKLEEAADFLRDHLDPAKNLKHKIAVKEQAKPERPDEPKARGKRRSVPV